MATLKRKNTQGAERDPRAAALPAMQRELRHIADSLRRLRHGDVLPDVEDASGTLPEEHVADNGIVTPPDSGEDPWDAERAVAADELVRMPELCRVPVEFDIVAKREGYSNRRYRTQPRRAFASDLSKTRWLVADAIRRHLEHSDACFDDRVGALSELREARGWRDIRPLATSRLRKLIDDAFSDFRADGHPGNDTTKPDLNNQTAVVLAFGIILPDGSVITPATVLGEANQCSIEVPEHSSPFPLGRKSLIRELRLVVAEQILRYARAPDANDDHEFDHATLARRRAPGRNVVEERAKGAGIPREELRAALPFNVRFSDGSMASADEVMEGERGSPILLHAAALTALDEACLEWDRTTASAHRHVLRYVLGERGVPNPLLRRLIERLMQAGEDRAEPRTDERHDDRWIRERTRSVDWEALLDGYKRRRTRPTKRKSKRHG